VHACLAPGQLVHLLISRQARSLFRRSSSCSRAQKNCIHASSSSSPSSVRRGFLVFSEIGQISPHNYCKRKKERKERTLSVYKLLEEQRKENNSPVRKQTQEHFLSAKQVLFIDRFSLSSTPVSCLLFPPPPPTALSLSLSLSLTHTHEPQFAQSRENR
jgi:hypothetical protein